MPNIGTGKGGRSFQDRELAAEVRRLTLLEIKGILEDDSGKDKTFRKQILLKMAGQILPRLNEVSGPDGEPLYLPTEIMGRYDLKRTDAGSKADSK